MYSSQRLIAERLICSVFISLIILIPVIPSQVKNQSPPWTYECSESGILGQKSALLEVSCDTLLELFVSRR